MIIPVKEFPSPTLNPAFARPSALGPDRKDSKIFGEMFTRGGLYTPEEAAAMKKPLLRPGLPPLGKDAKDLVRKDESHGDSRRLLYAPLFSPSSSLRIPQQRSRCLASIAV